MPTYTTANQSIQHFGDGYTTVLFSRPTSSLLLAATGAVEVSFDGGLTFMDLGVDTFHNLPIRTKRIDFRGAGSVNGCGICN